LITQTKSALLLIDVQRGFLHPSWGKRNNPQAESNIRLLLGKFRHWKLPVIHIHHLSTETESPLRPGQDGVEPMNGCEPRWGERVFQKRVNSSFIGTGLHEHLKLEGIRELFMAGFTTDHCVSTSARMAANLGFTVTVVSDASATFERKQNSIVYDPELVHEIHLASLSNEFASIQTTKEVELSLLIANRLL
jgi:nicotinamidase-related amidase